ncbi:MAG TPA: hypothetical protein PK677_15730 [Acidiphilium sp.]|uniref:Helix-turn-helix domain-containing protein n=1 Tax=Acidiphilium acidophilum TaxID=76588 RepID=A0AAW9DLT4_ACIAO|nr:hypothetical protein [Acidiphilium acidophilum]MDX5929433.1 hypothetical protein [Acidiphilium acidophilum]OZB38142.1 MAG: hypothetical protein B7X48_14295 [Acidiphilium sp. 34-60-192]HQT89965.1 hypothetical protein [Acidiphilium sp.]
MTPLESLATIRWSYSDLAAAIGRPSDTVRSWVRRNSFPAPIVEWLARLADAHRALPPPDLAVVGRWVAGEAGSIGKSWQTVAGATKDGT